MAAPVIILVRPQLGENIGAAARAMLNFGLTELRLVAPRDGWPSAPAHAMASGADAILDNARLFDTLAEALADLHSVGATSARPRGMAKPVLDPAATIAAARARLAAGDRAGLVFGPERSGLTNDEVGLADFLITIPTNPSFASINLAQAVLLLGFAWFTSQGHAAARPSPEIEPPAAKSDLFQLFAHLEAELDQAGFLYPPEKRPSMVQNLRAMLTRARLTDQEVRTLRGAIRALTENKARRKRVQTEPGRDSPSDR